MILLALLQCHSSALTVAILKKRYLAHVKSDAFSTEARLYLKEVVQEELRKMLVFFLLLIFENDLGGFWTFN